MGMCHDADMIIEESSILYFEKLNWPTKRFFSSSKDESLKWYSESASKAIGKYIPEVNHTFSSFEGISKCILQTSTWGALDKLSCFH